ELADHRGHLLRDTAGDDHEIGLPRRRPEHLGAKARDIETRGAHGHHLNGAAGQAERHGPDGALAHPVHHVVERGENYPLRLLVSKQNLPHVLDIVRIAGGVLKAPGTELAFDLGISQMITHTSILMGCTTDWKQRKANAVTGLAGDS